MAVVRLKLMEKVAKTPENSGMTAMARLDIYGMGLQNDITVHGLSYDMPKTRAPDDCRQSTMWMHWSRSSQRAPGQEASSTADSSSPRSRPPMPSAPVSRGSDCSPRSIAEEILMLAGESGCVKTALLDMMAALMPPDSEKITLGRPESVQFMHGISKGVGI